MKRPASLIRLAQYVGEMAGLSGEVLLGRGRSREIVRARFAFWLAAHEDLRPGWSVKHLATVLGRDHTTLLHGLKRARAMRESDFDFAGLQLLASGKARAIRDLEIDAIRANAAAALEQLRAGL